MRISILRRDPWPDCAITFWRRSRLPGLLPPSRSRRLPFPKRGLLGLPLGRAHSGTTPPGHSRRWLRHGFEDRAELVERRQLLEGTQVEVVEEFAGGGEERGTPGRLAMAHGFDPAALLERLERRGRDRHAAYLLDVAARDRLAIGDDR